MQVAHFIDRSRRGFRASSPAGRQGALSAPGLCFITMPGPLLVLVGLCGGAGVSTLACLTAATAAAQSEAPVLVCDTGGPTAGLAVYTGVKTPRTLADTAEGLAVSEPLSGSLFAVAEHGLRVIAGEPQFTVDGEKQGVQRVLKDARDAHVLTVVDGGTLARAGDRAALGVASHVAWMLPASDSALTRARRVLARLAPLSVPELIVARWHSRKAPVRELRDLAEERRASLVLMPEVRDLTERPALAVASEAALTLQAIGGLLRR
jgi:Flp pilus assembly CpaE family ATPase